MPRIADALERESRTVDLEQGDFERLLGRRERKQRNRRIRAGALGVIVALAIGAIFVRSLASDPIPVDPPVVPRPAPAPAASGTLTYILDGDIFVADPDGSNAVKIANGRPDNECARGSVGEQYWAEGSMWSPDGRYLAYRHTECSDPEFRGGVEISDAEGNVITTFPTGAGWDIAWSPDSTRVAVWDAFGETIGVYGVDGARQTQLTMPPGWTLSGDHDPVWMPDGTSLMVEDVELPLDGGTPRRLPLPAGAWSTTYSPDGSHVAYVDNRSLMVARSDGSEAREVFGGWAAYSAWSPTGDRIAFSDGESLRLLDVATGEVTRLTEEQRGMDLRVMGFSPEGDRVLFSTIESDSLWSIGVNGSAASLVVAGTWQGKWLSAKATDEPMAADARPTPAPAASGSLAYVLDGDIYVADADGSNAVRIADGRPAEDCGNVGGYWAEGPMWSPDGRYLAYRYSDCSGGAAEFHPGGVVISDAEGNVLARFPAQGWNIVWSPDSTRVAVWDRYYDPPSTIGVYGLNGARQTQLTMPPGWSVGGDHDPVWMPDGSSLMVEDMELPLDGGTPRQLPLPAGAWSTTYSPDGSHVAYVEDDSLVVAAADGSDAREMVGSWSDDPDWSPTGDRIAFTYSETNVRGSNELRVLDVATGEVTPLFGRDGSAEIGSVQFSPEGDRMLFVMTNSLWTINADGTDARRLVAGTIQGDWS